MEKKNIIIIGAVALVVFLLILLLVLSSRETPAPTHLSIEEVSSHEVTISWIGIMDSNQYNIYRSDQREGGFEGVGFATEESFTDRSLEPNKEYYYVVSQMINLQESSFSPVLTVKTDPAIPQNLIATKVSYHEELAPRIDLRWDYSIGADEYIIYRATEKDGEYQKIGTAVNENFSDEDVEVDTRYYYAVAQISDGREGDFGEIIGITTDSSWACGDVLEYGEQVYQTLIVGGQCWFQENLNIKSSEETEGRCQMEGRCYDDDPFMCERYGSLYNYSTASCNRSYEGARGICPLGWRIPTDDDWIALEEEIGVRERDSADYGFRGANEASMLAGQRSLWKEGALIEDNSFSSLQFNALPGGRRLSHGVRPFRGVGEEAVFWSSTSSFDDDDCTVPSHTDSYVVRRISHEQTSIQKSCFAVNHYAYIRCVRDY